MSATFYVGDAIEVMSKLPEKSVDLILTSPPFLALRSYLPADHPDKAKEGGSQSTPGEFIDWLIDVVEACDRVLAPHGSLCFELGDTYSGAGGAGGDWSDSPATTKARVAGGSNGGPTRRVITDAWPLAKSLSLIPETFRFAMVYGFNPLTGRTTERWRLRNVVRWVRPNPPVGALGDKFRPATSELMVFCKSAKRYFDLDAVREPYKPMRGAAQAFPVNVRGNEQSRRSGGVTERIAYDGAGAPPLDWWKISEEELDPRDVVRRALGGETVHFKGVVVGPGTQNLFPDESGAPPLDWWNIPPGGYEGAHYAVFPPELCVKPVKAMSPERVCRVCGEPSPGYRLGHRNLDGNQPLGHDNSTVTTRTDLGWISCPHDSWRPGLVLDPFAGSGTTLAVATGHGRDAIGIDLDERNYDLALERVGPFILERAG